MSLLSLNDFLAKLTSRIAPHVALRNLIVEGMRSPEVFDSFEKVFRDDLGRFFDLPAIDFIDRLAVNEYWFIMMAAATLVRTKHLPAGKDDVREGLFVLRSSISSKTAESQAAFAKIRQGIGDKMSGTETAAAKQDALLVWDASQFGSPTMKPNPVFFQNTSEW